MTQENADERKVGEQDAKHKKVLPEKQDETTQDPAAVEELRDERDRRMIVFTVPFYLMLAAPMFLAMEDGRSIWRMTRNDSIGRAIMAAVFAGPIFLGFIGISRGLRRREPKKWLMRVGTTLTSLYTLAGTALVIMAFLFERKAAASPWMWLSVLMASLSVGSLVRSFFHNGWRRWQFIAAPIALLAVMLVLMLAGLEPRGLERAEQGGWVYLFGAAGLLPFVGTVWLGKK